MDGTEKPPYTGEWLEFCHQLCTCISSALDFCFTECVSVYFTGRVKCYLHVRMSFELEGQITSVHLFLYDITFITSISSLEYVQSCFLPPGATVVRIRLLLGLCPSPQDSKGLEYPLKCRWTNWSYCVDTTERKQQAMPARGFEPLIPSNTIVTRWCYLG
jgi:hypothetical protein